jgi:nucleotide-binding universal stress UspA family protein
MAPEIVVPLVGRELDPQGASEQALPYARALAKRLEANLVLASIVHAEQDVEDRRAYLDGLLDDDLEPRILSVVVVAEDPATAIVDLAHNLEGSVIVMASHSRTGLKRMILGSVTLQVVLGTDRPVMVVPVTGSPPEIDTLPSMRRLLIPLDDSFMAEAVLQTATATLGGDDLRLHLLDALEPLSTRGGFMEGEYQSTVRQVATHYLSRVAGELRAQGYDTEWQIRVGDPALEIATVAEEDESDVIVMATHGRSGLGRFIFSSIGRLLANATQVPMLLIRPDEEAIERAKAAARIVRTLPG